MSDETDFLNLASTPTNTLGITTATSIAEGQRDIEGSAQDRVDHTALRLVELLTSPIRGGFDTLHLKQIHHHIYQDTDPSAGQFRDSNNDSSVKTDVETSLDSVFDRLSRENHLKGLAPEEWADKISSYMLEIGTIQPFVVGNELVIREFAAELARKNGLGLQFDDAHDITLDNELMELTQLEQSMNLRRMIMLAMDTSPSTQHPGRGSVLERGLERILSFGNTRI